MTAKERKAKVYHADLFGLRKEKYAWLSEHDWETTTWQEVNPRSEFYLFIPRDEEALERYESFPKITDIFPVNSSGIKTHRDHFVIDFDQETLKRRLRTFLDPRLSDEFVGEAFALEDSRTWTLEEARKGVQKDENCNAKIIPCLYRPFDVRYLFYHSSLIERNREEVMRHFITTYNIGLAFTRQVTYPPFSHALVTEHVMELKLGSHDRNTYLAPLYLCPPRTKNELLPKQKDSKERKPNLESNFLETLREDYHQSPLPETLLGYIYAVLYSPMYRKTYVELLRLDFPRIPFTKDAKLFQKLAELGKRLVDLHLLRSSELDPPIARFQGDGDNRVQNGKKGLRYDPNAQRVYINREQFFEGVPAEVWEYPIGGYQVCHKWLKDRKDRCLSLEEIKTYCRIVTALSKTIAIQADIDKLYPQVEKTLLEIQLRAK